MAFFRNRLASYVHGRPLGNKTVLTILSITAVVVLGAVVVRQLIFKENDRFRQIRTDGRFEIVGAYPFEEKEDVGQRIYHFKHGKWNNPDTIDYEVHSRLIKDNVFGVARILVEKSEMMEKRTYFDDKGRPTCDNSGVHSVLLTFDKDGNPKSLSGYDNQDRPVADNSGVWEYMWSVDGEGRILKSVRTDSIGQRIADSSGVCENDFRLDENGNKLEIQHHALNGAITEDVDGIATLRMKYDDYGNVIETTSFDVKSNKVLNKRTGFATERNHYNQWGELTGTAYTGIDEKPVLRVDLGASEIHWKFDLLGNMTEKAFLGVDRHWIEERSSGLAITQISYDKNSNPIEYRFYGADGKFKLDNELGVAILRCKRDGHGNTLEEAGYDEKGILKDFKTTGVATIRYKYDGFGRGEIEERSYGIDGKIKDRSDNGSAVKRIELDKETQQYHQVNYTVKQFLELLASDLDSEDPDTKANATAELEGIDTPESARILGRFHLGERLVQAATLFATVKSSYREMIYDLNYNTLSKDYQAKSKQIMNFAETQFTPAARGFGDLIRQYADNYGGQALIDLSVRYPIINEDLANY